MIDVVMKLLDYELAPSAEALSAFSQHALPQTAFNPQIKRRSHCSRLAGLPAERPAEKRGRWHIHVDYQSSLKSTQHF